MNSGVQIPCFIFEMYDEDKKSTAPGAFETYWGVYEYDSQNSDYVAKYTLNWGGSTSS